MEVKYLLTKTEVAVPPFASVASIEDTLIDSHYVVVKDDDEFRGILTQADVLRMGHLLVVDCLVEKKRLDKDDEIEEVLAVMFEENQYVLPVFDGEGYLGSVSYFRIIKELSLLRKPPVHVQINNVIGGADAERVKHVFINELYHNTKNPIQIIYSSLNLYRQTAGQREREILIESIRSSTKQIDDVINELMSTYTRAV